ncbi:M1 family metallopeptidase [Streptomyces griseocarneus]|uniref:M1 family metallopeptidase n=1 Tax=Streptomyces griseocarneus TaxID=51201 RepID=UPI00167E4657|nr:M1 family metallopeptidase [Streptomyces griseocarneus]MBZ6472806.1 M1 family metallopeptidase [Streptomyces griseocarneus]GHG47439.1 peptidase [Streptomyces griseocarneus]
MRHRLIVPSAAAAFMLLAVPASAADATPGAPGAGDAYYPASGNGGYDVSHYDLRLKYEPKSDKLDGTATLTATTTQALSRFNLDFALKVSEVLVNGKPTAFTRTGDHELEITPASPLEQGKEITVVVRYSDTPSQVKIGGYSAWQRTPDGAVVANEPESAVWWFPSNDHPRDKATYDISVSVPDGLQTVSNGELKSQTSKLGWTRYNWRATKPQASYLTTLAVGKFDITTDKTADGLPVLNAYSKDLGDNLASAKASVGRTTEIIDWESKVFGPYPFNAIGGYVPNVKTGYALETQTRPYYSPSGFANGANTSLVVHELAHQWFGDSVSVKNWRDIWVNEGFATYAQWLWSEKEGEGTAQQLADYIYNGIPADNEFWKVKPSDPGADKQFHSAVYNRGAIALQALRNKVGDKTFFALIKDWTEQNRFGNGSVEDFVKFAEKASGKPLQKLFDTWLNTASKPSAAAAAKDGIGKATAGASGKSLKAAEPKSWKKIQEAQRAHRH